jgi:hypothetical protein
MAATLRGFFGRLLGGGGAGTEPEAGGPAEEYNGYRIRPTPFPRNGQFQTSGVIEKDFDGETKQHRFIRAEAHPTRDDAVAFSIAKAKQIIDAQGDRIFTAG